MSAAIVIASYNSAQFLRGVIESTLRQTVPPVEVTVIDDGSTDATAAVCEQFGGRIRYRRQKNSGVSSARNHGAHLTASEWLLFLDSDDFLLPHALEALIDCATRADAGVAYGRVLMRGRGEYEMRLHGLPSAAGAPPHPAVVNYRRSVLSTPGAAVVRRSLHERIGGFVSGFEPMEDRDYWVKCGLLKRFAFCDTAVLDKTFREGSAGTQISRRVRSAMRSRLALPAWAAARGIDLGVLEVAPKGVVDLALKEAIWHRCWPTLSPLLAEARDLKVQSFWVWRAKIQLWLARRLGWAGKAEAGCEEAAR
jgi:glycosyltransferase involved in cell wall biosynthesis